MKRLANYQPKPSTAPPPRAKAPELLKRPQC